MGVEEILGHQNLVRSQRPGTADLKLRVADILLRGSGGPDGRLDYCSKATEGCGHEAANRTTLRHYNYYYDILHHYNTHAAPRLGSRGSYAQFFKSAFPMRKANLGNHGRISMCSVNGTQERFCSTLFIQKVTTIIPWCCSLAILEWNFLA